MFLIVPTNAPVLKSKPLMVPVLVLLAISNVLLRGPKLFGATAIPPWLIQRRTLNQSFHKGAVFAEDVHITACSTRGIGKQNVQLAVDVRNVRRSKASGEDCGR